MSNTIPAQLAFSIGNAELVNYMVEQQIQRLREEREALAAELRGLGDKSTKRLEGYSAACLKHFEEVYKPKVKAVLALFNPKAADKLDKMLVYRNPRQTMSSEIPYYVGLKDSHCNTIAGECVGPLLDSMATAGFNHSIKLSRADKEAVAADTKRAQALNARLYEIDQQLNKRSDIEKSMLAQLTKTIMGNNPQLVSQLQQVASDLIANAPLLNLPAK